MRTVLLGALLVLVAAPGARAASVETRLAERDGTRAWEVAVTAAAGERNDLELTQAGDEAVRVTDAGADLVAGGGCRALGARVVECRADGFLYVVAVTAGDGDDRVRSAGASGPRLLADGGPGDDLLEGSDGKGDVLDGGGGRDRLLGRGNGDRLTDGDRTGAADADVLDGGADVDHVSYAGRTAPVAVDLGAAARGGEAGEGDVLAGLEGATGGGGDDLLDGGERGDVLRGGAGADHLDGHGGADVLQGEEGDDVLHGHAGNDALTGGTGADRLRGAAGIDVLVRPSGADRAACGDGRDVLAQPRDGVRVPSRRCEALTWSFDAATGRRTSDEGTSVDVAPLPVAATRQTLAFAVGCPRPAGSAGLCALRARQVLRVRGRDGRLLGTGALDRSRYRRRAARERGRSSRIVVALTPAGRRRLAGGALVTVVLRTSGVAPVRWRARLRAG